MLPVLSRGLVSRARRRLRLATRRAYLSLAAGRFGGLARIGVVERLRRRWQRPIEPDDVLQVLDALSAADVRSWVAGGWGIDALVREQTRPHKDLDLVVDAAQLGEAFAALRGLGLRRVPETEPGADRHVPDSLMPHRELVQDAGGRTVDLHPVRSATWLADVGVERAFATGSIGGRTVDCLSVAAQRAAHQGFELAAEHEANLRSIERLGSGPDAP